MPPLRELTLDDLYLDSEDEWPTTPVENAPAGTLTEAQRHWTEHGWVLHRNVIPEPLLVDYEAEWLAVCGGRGAALGQLDSYRDPGGWQYATPYMHHPALRAVGCSAALHAAMAEVIGAELGLHLCLTGWRSTARNWHQDGYLNEPGVGNHYLAAWVALDDLAPESGPFQFVDGSHRWPMVSREKLGRHIDLRDPQWPKHSEDILVPLFEAKLADEGHPVTSLLDVHRGDVLLWHARLLHRGSVPTDPHRERRSLIMHFSAVGVRRQIDMPNVERHELGGQYFVLGGPA